MAALSPSLQPTERRVVETILEDRSTCVDHSAQDLAERVGVGRSTVIRAVQSLGYDGFPQLRVALARELALEPSPDSEDSSDRSTPLGTLRAHAEEFAAHLPGMLSALTSEVLDSFLRTLDDSDRVLVVANGLSSPLGLDMALRLNAAGRTAEHFLDAMGQRIAARQLGVGSSCLVLSGSGANRLSVEALRAAHDSGATTLAVTSFAHSAIAEVADITLVIPPMRESFTEELLHTSRAGLTFVTEQIVDLLADRRGERARTARANALSVLGSTLQEE